MAYDFAISTLTNDISISKGKVALVNGNAEIVQRIKTRLQWLTGEWFLDTTKGLPWMQEILGDKNTNNAVMLIRDQITGTSGVDRVSTINVRFDAQKRELSIYAVAVVNGQNTVINQGVIFG